MQMKTLIILGIIGLLVFIFIFVQASKNEVKTEEEEKSVLIPDSLEGCQKQRAILMYGISKELKRRE
jgi:hypothetical protein